jgi:hypothetical protein
MAAATLFGPEAKATALVDQGVIGCGQTRSEVIVGDEMHVFNFDAAVGEKVVTTVVGPGTTIALNGPGGPVLLNDSLDPCSGICVSETFAAGAHTITASSAGGAYNITLEAATGTLNAVACAGSQPLACGQTRSGASEGANFDVLGESDSFTFEADADEKVVITAWPSLIPFNNQPVMKLFDNNGDEVALANFSGDLHIRQLHGWLRRHVYPDCVGL